MTQIKCWIVNCSPKFLNCQYEKLSATYGYVGQGQLYFGVTNFHLDSNDQNIHAVEREKLSIYSEEI